MKSLSILGYLFHLINAASGECEDSDEFKFTPVILSIDPKTSLRYRSTETKLEIIMQTEASAFLGFGFASDGTQKMVGNNAIIGTVMDDTSPYGLPLKYSLGAQNAKGISQLGNEEQTLTNNTYASIPGSGSQMNFTKSLSDGSEVINAEGDVRFIWAVGNDHSLTGHAIRGSVVLPLRPCSNNVAANAKKARDYKTATQVHGIAAAFAIGLLIPIATIATSFRRFAIFDREIRGFKVWFLVHSCLNILSFLVIIGVFVIAILCKNAVNGKHFRKSHEKVGLVLLILLSVQVIATAIFRPKDSNRHKSTDNSVDDIEPFGDQDENGRETKKSNINILVGLHRVSGLVIVALFMFNIFSGIEAYERIYGEKKTLKVLYWVWLGFAIAFTGVVFLRRILVK